MTTTEDQAPTDTATKAVKHFGPTAEEDLSDVFKPRTFTLHGQDSYEYTATRPKDAVMAKAAAAASTRVPLQVRIAAIIDFFDAALSPINRTHFRDRFEDPEDVLDLEHVVPAAAWLAEEWESDARAAGLGGNRAERRKRR